MNHSSSEHIAGDLRALADRLGAGAQLPSTRSLVERYHASPVTVQKALRALTTEALIESRPGVGTFVSATQVPRPVDYGWQASALRPSRVGPPGVPAALQSTPNDVIALHSGYPDRALLPERLIRAALGRATRSDAALSRPPVGGLPELQLWFARELAAGTPRGVTPPAADDVIVLPGSQSALSSIFRALVGPGETLVMESPTYWGAIHAAAHARVRVVSIPTGAAGPRPEDLDRALRETGARAVYTQPHFANPTGARWPASLCEQMLRVVEDRGAFLIEDDWAHDLAFDDSPAPIAGADRSGHIIYLRSLTKSISPAIRVAALVGRGPARERLLADRSATSMYVSGVLQAAALDVVTQPAWQTHLRALRRQLRDRRDLLLESLRALAPAVSVEHVPEGGLNLWARLPDGTDVAGLVARCREAGLLIAPGDDWFPSDPAGAFIRLSYAGPDPSKYPQAVRILGRELGGRP